MNLALVENGSITEYPYSYSQLRKAHPNVSFPKDPSNVNLTGFGVVSVQNTAVPDFDARVQRVLEAQPSLIDGQWTQTWEIQDLSADTIAELEANQASSVRKQRNNRLSDCDWTQLADSPLDADAKLAWQLYRETLRMVPEQTGFPWNVEWPPLPA